MFMCFNYNIVHAKNLKGLINKQVEGHCNYNVYS